MNDKRESSLAITEKKPHKPGGCVGIFFQLFDWNRRFAKKKLFSKKLLPPARPTKAPRKFGSDDKLPKHRLIANENSGGFPNAKRNGNANGNPTNERKSETKAPGLVARLMGLESMPAVRQDESKNDSFFDSDEEGFQSGFNYDMFDKEEVDKAMVCGKHEVRPQKLQKTGALERQPLTRFGAEALQFRNVLSRSRKHHPKLASPVKSPRMSTGRNSSRLFDAAARILEPGLQATSRAKCTIAYSRSLHQSPNAEVLQETKPQSPNFSENCNYHVSAANALSGQSCRNCGSSLEEDAVPFAACASNYVNPCFQNSDRSEPRPASSFSFEVEKVKAMDRCKEKPSPLCAEARNGVRSQTEAFRDRNPFTQEGPQRHSASHQFRSQKNDQSLTTAKNRARQNQVMRGRDRAPPKSSSCHLQNNRVPSATNAISERKNAVLKSQNLTSRARSRVPVKVENNGKSEGERRACNKQDCPLSPVRKRRPGNVSPQGESSAFVSPDFAAQRNSRRDVTTGKGLGLGIHSVNRSSKRNIMSRAGVNSKVASTKDNDVVAFTFKSPMKQKTEGDFTYGSTRDYSLSESTDRNSIPDNLSVVTGDALGALLEQKLKELTSQCEDDLTAENTPPKRTTAIILQELIYALNAEKPETHNDTIIRPNQEKVSCHDNEVLNRKLTFQDKKRTSGASVGYSRDIDRHSPGSILEASFSNDSCLSSSLDDSSGPNQYPDSVDTSYNGSQTLEADAELWDSVTSIDKQTSGLQLVIDLSQISGVFFSLGFPETAMYEIKLAHAKEVILNTEFVFRNLPHPGTSERRDDFSLSRFLTGELEALGSALSANDVDLPTFMDVKDGNQLRQRFLFDCAIECLESIYAPYSNTGFAAWRRLPSCMTNNKLISGAVYEVKRWARFAGMSPDEIIERDMSHSSGKWTDFEVEAYESGAELCDDLLQVLFDEVISDFDMLGAYGM